MHGYLPRVVDAELDALLRDLPAVALEGIKAIGKTATAERRVSTTFRLDEPGPREVAMADPWLLLAADPPILIDEWQHVPAVWDVVRRAVDEDPTPNRVLLTGSASPRVAPTHSGAGRIVTVRMRPLALSERELGDPSVSLAELLMGTKQPVEGKTDVSLADYAAEIVRSGFPGVRRLAGRPLRAQLDGYLARIVDRDFVEQGSKVRRPDALRRWMAAFAAATATTSSLEKIRNAAMAGGDVPTKPVVLGYRDVLEQLWVIDQVPGWTPSRNHLTRLAQAPKHHLADPALAARLLGLDEHALLTGTAGPSAAPRDGTIFGNLFESLVTLSVRVYAQSAEADVRHLRTHEGRHEVDLIVVRPDQRVVAVEVKLSATVDDEDVRHMLWLGQQLGDDVLDMVIITTGKYAYRRPDGVAVVPASLLGP